MSGLKRWDGLAWRCGPARDASASPQTSSEASSRITEDDLGLSVDLGGLPPITQDFLRTVVDDLNGKTATEALLLLEELGRARRIA